MKKYLLPTAIFVFSVLLRGQTAAVFETQPQDDAIGSKTVNYFQTIFEKMNAAAAKDPDADTFRDAMKPLAETTEGFYGGTLLDSNWVIKQVYFPSHFLAKGFDLHKVKELSGFIKQMHDQPGPQLSEPGHGSLLQPRLIAMRYPVIREGKMTKMVSIMVRTEAFLKAVGLDQCKAYRITCLGQIAEEKGKLSNSASQATLTLPATEWVIDYDR